MEVWLQYLDELDDLVGIIGLCGERIRRGLLLLLSSILFCSFLLGGVVLALEHPALALGAVTMLSVVLLYRRVARPGLGYAD